MALRFIGVDPPTPQDGCPTVWVDEADGSIVVQGWKVLDDETLREVRDTGTGIHPDREPIPDSEAVVRIPARMIPILREACDGGA